MVNLNNRVPTAAQVIKRFYDTDAYTQAYMEIQNSFLEELRKAISNKDYSLVFGGEVHNIDVLLDFKKWLQDNGYEIVDVNTVQYNDTDVLNNCTRYTIGWRMKVRWD